MVLIGREKLIFKSSIIAIFRCDFEGGISLPDNIPAECVSPAPYKSCILVTENGKSKLYFTSLSSRVLKERLK